MTRVVAIEGLVLLAVMLSIYGACRLLSGDTPPTTLDVAPRASSRDDQRPAVPALGRGTFRMFDSTTSAGGSRDSFHDLEARAQQLSPAELESELAELDARIEHEAWIERANSDELSEVEREDLAFLFRQRNALATVRARRRVAAWDDAGGH